MRAYSTVDPVVSRFRMYKGAENQRQRHGRAQGVHNAKSRLRDGITDNCFVSIQIRDDNVESRYIGQPLVFTPRFDSLKETL